MPKPQADDVAAVPGTYLVWLRLAAPVELTVGRLGRQALAPGLLVYVGSAHGPGGLRARLRRHLRTTKTLHWHIDSLTTAVPVVALWYAELAARLECDWSRAIAARPGVDAPIVGFGASDCACPTHLFAVPPDQLRALWDQLDRPCYLSDDATFTVFA